MRRPRAVKLSSANRTCAWRPSLPLHPEPAATELQREVSTDCDARTTLSPCVWAERPREGLGPKRNSFTVLRGLVTRSDQLVHPVACPHTQALASVTAPRLYPALGSESDATNNSAPAQVTEDEQVYWTARPAARTGAPPLGNVTGAAKLLWFSSYERK
jgi:hypothetical protein